MTKVLFPISDEEYLRLDLLLCGYVALMHPVSEARWDAGLAVRTSEAAFNGGQRQVRLTFPIWQVLRDVCRVEAANTGRSADYRLLYRIIVSRLEEIELAVRVTEADSTDTLLAESCVTE